MSPDKQELEELRIDRSAAPKRKVRAGLVLGVMAVVIVVLGLIWWFTRPEAVVVRTFVVQAPASGSDRTLLNASGYVTARRAATVSSKITAKVIEVLIEEGMKVETGQVLARLDSSNVGKSLQLAQAQAESVRQALGETRVNLEQAGRELRRVTQLAAEKIATASELDRARAEASSLEARLARQEADVAVADREVALWEQQLEDTIIRAPFSGIVTSKDAQPGEMISPVSAGGGFTRTGICTIVDMSSLEIEVDVSESYINRVVADQPVEATLDSYPAWRIPGKVLAIIPTADRQKATVKVRVGLEKLDPRILPDMSAKVAFQSAGDEKVAVRVLTIPKPAVRQENGQNIAWVVRDGRVERRAVTIGMAGDDDLTIAAGLNSGDRIVIESSSSLADGQRVTERKP